MFRLFRDSLIRLTDRDLFIRMETKGDQVQLFSFFTTTAISLLKTIEVLFLRNKGYRERVVLSTKHFLYDQN